MLAMLASIAMSGCKGVAADTILTPGGMPPGVA